MLADKIKEGKITKKWIERCLPQEYRRTYAKSELCDDKPILKSYPQLQGKVEA